MTIDKFENAPMWKAPRTDSLEDRLRWRESLGNAYVSPELVHALSGCLQSHLDKHADADLDVIFKEFGVSEHLIRVAASRPALKYRYKTESEIRLQARKYLAETGASGTAMYWVYNP